MSIEVQYDKIFDAQQHYRLLLDSMARPGKINTLPPMQISPPDGFHAASVLIGFSLFNADVSFCVFDASPESEASEFSGYIVANTAAVPLKIEEADFVFLSGTDRVDVIDLVKTGTLSYPEGSATLIIDVQGISETAQAGWTEITLNGPGIDGQRKLFVKGLSLAFLAQLALRNEEFPLGIDCILTDDRWQIVCIPRSTTITN